MLAEVVSSYCCFRKIKKNPTCNVRSIFSRHSMLASLFMLHCISYIKHQIQRQPTLNIGSSQHSMLGQMNVYRKQYPTFMLSLLCLLQLIYIYLGKGKKSNIQCQLILITKTFPFTIMIKIGCQNLCQNYDYLSSERQIMSIWK